MKTLIYVYDVLSCFIKCIILGVMIFLIVILLGGKVIVQGSSMETSLYDSESLLCDKITYKISEPERFDVIVFPPDGYKNHEQYIKRIIGMPGEIVQIKRNGDIYINEELIVEFYGNEVIAANNRGIAKKRIVLKDDEYFVMGDNRNNSIDSRVFGPIKKEYITGKITYRLFPFSKFGEVKK